MFKKIIALILFFGCTLSLKAQDKYEYGSIYYSQWLRKMEISLNGSTYEKIDISKTEVKGSNDMNPAFIQLNKLIDQGWELLTINSVTGSHLDYTGQLFFIRKKIN